MSRPDEHHQRQIDRQICAAFDRIAAVSRLLLASRRRAQAEYFAALCRLRIMVDRVADRVADRLTGKVRGGGGFSA